MFMATRTESGFSFRLTEQVLDGLEAAVRGHAEPDRGSGDLGDEVERGVIVIDHAHGRGREQAHVEHPHGVAVRLRVAHQPGARRPTGRGVVDDYQGLRQQLVLVDGELEETDQDVRLPARRDRHDGADRLLRIARREPEVRCGRQSHCGRGSDQGRTPRDACHGVLPRVAGQARACLGSNLRRISR
jgi:hypothetical protein